MPRSRNLLNFFDFTNVPVAKRNNAGAGDGLNARTQIVAADEPGT